jgi:hypothetical protein
VNSFLNVIHAIVYVVLHVYAPLLFLLMLAIINASTVLLILGMHQCQLTGIPSPTGYKLHVLAVKPINSCSMNTKHHLMSDPVGLGTPPVRLGLTSNANFCVLKKWVHSRIGQCVRPSVYTITLEKLVRFLMKFCTQIYLINISLEFEDENNSSRIYWVTARNIIIFYSLLCNYWPIPIFANQNFCHSQNEISTIIYHSIENFMGYTMMLNCRDHCAALKISSIP